MSNPKIDRAATAVSALRTQPDIAALAPLEQLLVGHLAEAAPELDRELVGAAWLVLADALGRLLGRDQEVPARMLVQLGQLAGQRLYSGTDAPLETGCPVVHPSGRACKFTATGATQGLVDAMMQTHYATYHPGETWPPEVEKLAPESMQPEGGAFDQEAHFLNVVAIGEPSGVSPPLHELHHPEACDRLKYGQRCPFDTFEGPGGPGDFPKETGVYLGHYWLSKMWTDSGWEYDAGIQWQREDAIELPAQESATPTIGRCDDCRCAVGITPSEHVLPGFAFGAGRVLCAECALNRGLVAVNDVRAAYGLPPFGTPIGPLPESARGYDGIIDTLGGAVYAGSAEAAPLATQAVEGAVVTADDMRRELGVGSADSGYFAKCRLCGDPVFVYDDGSTEGGVSTVVGIRCDRCVVLDAAADREQPTPQSVREGRHSINELRVHHGLAEVGLPDDEPMPEGLLDALIQATWAEAGRAGTLEADGFADVGEDGDDA